MGVVSLCRLPDRSPGDVHSWAAVGFSGHRAPGRLSLLVSRPDDSPVSRIIIRYGFKRVELEEQEALQV